MAACLLHFLRSFFLKELLFCINGCVVVVYFTFKALFGGENNYLCGAKGLRGYVLVYSCVYVFIFSLLFYYDRVLCCSFSICYEVLKNFNTN